jgi:hypothetical protein
MRTCIGEEYRTLIHYFLGELPEAEREAVEERYMLDEAYAELRDEVEMGLVDAYVGDTLTPLERRHFEQHYLVTHARREGVKAAYLSRVYRERIPQPVAPAPSAPRTVFFPRRSLVPAMAAAIVVLAIGASWFIYGLWGRASRSGDAVQTAANRTARPPSTPRDTGLERPTPASSSSARLQAGSNRRTAKVPSTSVPAMNQAAPKPQAAPARRTPYRGPAAAHTAGGAAWAAAPPPVPRLPGYSLVSQLQSTYIGASSVGGGMTSGMTLVVQKDGITATPAPVYCFSSYQDGKVTVDAVRGAASVTASNSRMFAAGEKVSLLNMQVRPDGLVFYVESFGTRESRAGDPSRYRAAVTIPFPEGYLTAMDLSHVMREVGEVFDIAKTNPQSPTAPSDKIELGDTEDHAKALLGQPQSILDLGSRKLYLYKDVTLTFDHGTLSHIYHGPQKDR